jgi:hypothetical protein
MRAFQLTKNTVCFRAILFTLICMLSFSLLSNTYSGLLMQNPQMPDMKKDPIFSSGIGKLHQYPLADIFAQQTFFYQKSQQLLSSENNSFATYFHRPVYGLLVRTTVRFILLSSQLFKFKTNSFLITLYCPNAPPCIFS